MSQPSPDCPADLMSSAIAVIKQNENDGLARVEALLDDYPADARLHFLRGSLLASLERYGDARVAMAKAIQIAPQFAVARFQLGFLELTSGDPGAAELTWAPLHDLPATEPLRIFANGLRFMINDQFGPAIETLLAGIAANAANPPINADMRLLIEKMTETLANQGRDGEPTSAAHLLLQQYASKSTKH